MNKDLIKKILLLIIIIIVIWTFIESILAYISGPIVQLKGHDLLKLERQIPPEQYSALEKLKDKDYPANKFLEILKKDIGVEKTQQYKKLIFEQAVSFPYKIYIFQLMCFFALGIYIIRTLKSAIKYFKDNGNKIFPTLLLAYSGIAAVIIFLSTLKLYVLPNSATKLMIIEDVDAYVINLTYIGFHIIMAAFYLNFSKAFYMLHELDHGHYDPIQNWNEKLNASKKWKRITEAFLRWLIAIFFIVLELTLHNVSSDGLIAALRTSAIFGLILYSLMLLWAMLNRFLLINQNEEETIKKKMKWQFYIAWAGIFNSLYIVLLAMLKKWWIIMPFSIATLLSIIILGYILIHMSKTSEETA